MGGKSVDASWGASGTKGLGATKDSVWVGGTGGCGSTGGGAVDSVVSD